MRAVLLHEYGDPTLLRVADQPEPTAGPGQLLVRVAAAAVNPVDLQVRSGEHAAHVRVPFPMILGWDLAGTVVQVGAGVSAFAPGDPVVAMSAQMATGVGTYAELVALDAALVAPAPRSVPLAHAAALPLAGLTAEQALDVLDLPAGRTLLVTGAAGSVGGFVVELARTRGLEVIAHGRPGDAGTVSAVPAGAADGWIDTAGLPGAIQGVRDGGRAVSIVPTAAPVAERGIEVRMSFVEQDGIRLAQLSKLVDEGALTIRVGGVFDLAEAPVAHARLAAGGSRGKLLLTP
ncbi:NADP-dependent oxidoreductase [Micromonospora sp. WMMD882]|uniref:NADP-dependent oxidoreductase n=1 Tax=Micromonospora sp. WMMD882 TaxID=3015151 RepID=UPI00248D1469|nr:NADP-dependent oxidoreductase [Micromonospora sp. WMMD882]WBB80510.1 NADP-dependent oxidoreductase [Micromonospora sp. WMMD882]